MKIESITTKNFMRLKSVHVDVSAPGVHLFCGPNESGKSSLKEAVRIALIGKSPRVTHKKDHGLLVTDGNRKGRVALKFRHQPGSELLEMHRNVDSENAVFPSDFRFDDLSVACLNFALQAESFAEAKEEDRRKLLNELLEIKMGSEKVIALLKQKYDIPESFCRHVQPLLRAGFEAAHKDAKLRKSNARTAWETATNENWGDEKVKTWAPAEDGDLVVVTPEELQASASQLQEFDAQLEALLTERGKLQATGDARARLLAERDETEQMKGQLRSFKAKRTGAVVDMQELDATIEDIQQRLALMANAAQVLSCPNCDHKFHLRQGELVPVDLEAMDIGAGDAPNEGQQRSILATKRAERATKQTLVLEMDGKIAKAAGAEARLTAIDAEIATMGESTDLDALQAKITQVQSDRANASVAHSKLTAAHALTAATEQKIASAKKAVADYFEWDKVVTALAPDGIPATLLLEQIKPINERLEYSAALAGWPRVQLNANMELVRDTPEEKRPYALLSESAKWRATALMADAISSMSEMRILVLDRMDVLTAGEERAKCMRWVSALAEKDYHTILVFATMAKTPKSDDVSGAHVHWMPELVTNQSTDK
jgi:hypothetical protein